MYKYLDKAIETSIDYIIKYDYKSLAFRAFILYGTCMNNIEISYRRLYNKNKWFRDFDYTVKYAVKYAIATSLLYRIDPFYNNWYSNVYIERTSIQQYILCEKIMAISNLSDIENIDSPNFLDPIIIGKFLKDDESTFYYCRRVFESEPKPIDNTSNSSTRFISVEYSNPWMNNSIEINLDKEWFIDGNEILGPSFIFRLLEYQSKNFVFDLN